MSWSLTSRLYLRPSRTPATEPSTIAPAGFDAKVLRASVLEALAYNGQQGAGCVEYSHPQHDIFESPTLFSLDLSCLNTMFCQRRERCSLT